MVASTEIDSGGADWTRTIVHWKGHYFAVLDRLEARQDDDYTFACRWRSLQSAALENGVWAATAPGGNVLRIQSRGPGPDFRGLAVRRVGKPVDPPAVQSSAPVQASGNDLSQPAVCFGAAEAG